MPLAKHFILESAWPGLRSGESNKTCNIAQLHLRMLAKVNARRLGFFIWEAFLECNSTTPVTSYIISFFYYSIHTEGTHIDNGCKTSSSDFIYKDPSLGTCDECSDSEWIRDTAVEFNANYMIIQHTVCGHLVIASKQDKHRLLTI